MPIEASPSLLNISQWRQGPSDGIASTDVKSHEGNSLLIAVEIFEGTFKEVPYMEYANFLGDPKNHLVLVQFIDLLDPLPLSLLSVLYTLCESLYFIAESQKIDRILEEVSKHWCRKHPNTVWKNNYKLCHIILFSLSILNSIIHNGNAQSSTNDKFTCEEFINNTFSALEPEFKKANIRLFETKKQIISELTSYFEGLKHKPLPLLKAKIYSNNDNINNDRTSYVSLKSNTNESTLMYNDSDMLSTKSSQRCKTLMTDWKFHNNIRLPLLYEEESFDDDFIHLNNSYWFMDCIIQISQSSFKQLVNEQIRSNRKNRNSNISSHKTDTINENPTNGSRKKKSRSLLGWLKNSKTKNRVPELKTNMEFIEQHTTWIKVKIRILEGRLYIFKFANDEDYKENDIEQMKLKSSVEFHVVNLFECIAELIQDNIVMSGDNSFTNFQLRFPQSIYDKPLIILFKTFDSNRSQNVVNCCNFWSARLSPAPIAQFEIVSNEEYGWSKEILYGPDGNLQNEPPTKGFKKINKWKPLLTLNNLYEFDDDSNVVNKQPFQEKLLDLRHFITKLDTLIDEHNSLKPLLLKRWQDTPQFEIVMDNWNGKYLYLHSQYDRRKIYYKVLQNANSQIAK